MGVRRRYGIAFRSQGFNGAETLKECHGEKDT
jgi:hypothetical protein